ncbi:MAG: nucleoside triphosphate pyrophosphohydrolase [Candidatus Nitronauta litoralis]|uniref:Nucleoside triphosphate pyrophosphohydrolase n=1 Tax=Candidatus Nitronauta litoralis TaxID=2705533 RepID=A0A7T0BXA6_9BACT|nr:MAG: nucleoside triphosphate pyrophosphohydrolase [Candidatus Nitronauta litoralis]
MNSSKKPEAAFSRLTSIVDTLMSEGGCPWDLVQTRESLKPYLVEETYETLEALDGNQPEKIVDEMGDLLYQILFHSKISENRGEFNITDVIENLSEKMIRRHPHVFSKKSETDTPEKVLHQWDEIKKQEKGNQNQKSVLDNVPKALPGLARAQKLQKKAAKQGFDWDQVEDVIAKLDEEVEEFKEAFRDDDTPHMTEEMGDLLFVIVNLARYKKIDAEEALRGTSNKFIKRFQHIEQEVAKRGKTLKETSLEEMERYWQEAKKL